MKSIDILLKYLDGYYTFLGICSFSFIFNKKVYVGSMLTYSFHIYKWPSNLLFEVAKITRNFLWSGNIDQKKICTVAWSSICKPKEEGGLSVRDPSKANQASLLLLTWKFLTSNEQWAHICRQRFLKNGHPKSHYLVSSILSDMKQYINLVLENSTWSVGNGQRIHFWTDKRLESSIVRQWNIPQTIILTLKMTVVDCIVEGKWRLPAFIVHRDTALAAQIYCHTAYW